MLAARGRHFCAGADLVNRAPGAGVPRDERTGRTLYTEAARLLRTRKPIVAAVHGAAIGAGLGLAVVADFRVTCAEARFSANFTRLGFHPGFGLTALLPRLIGTQRAAMLFYTGRRVPGDEAVALGLADQLVDQAEVRNAAHALAAEIATSGTAGRHEHARDPAPRLSPKPTRRRLSERPASRPGNGRPRITRKAWPR